VEAVKSPAAEPPITATFRLAERELELESFLSTRDSSTIYLCRIQLHLFFWHPQDDTGRRRGASPDMHLSMQSAPAGVPSAPRNTGEKVYPTGRIAAKEEATAAFA
jgi:hypothetical protein